jgi:hypothetical protein
LEAAHQKILEIVQLLFDTCGTGADGSKIINPVAFVEEIEKRKK